MKNSRRLRRVAPLAVAALVGAGLPALTMSAPANAAGTVTATRTTDTATGWVTSTESPGLGTVTYTADDTGSYGGYAALLQTGPGNSANPSSGGGKPYLNQGGFADVPIADLTDLGYSTRTLRADSDSRLAPAFNIQLRSGEGAGTFRGSLVFEPVYNKDAAGAIPSVGGWQTWDLNGRNAMWYSSRDITNSAGQVVIPANTTRRFGVFLDAFEANQGTYGNIRVNPGAPGINISLGQRGYSAATSNLVAEVDGVTVGAASKPTVTYDFESLGDCTSFDQASKTLSLTKDCSTTSTLETGDGWTVDGQGHTLTAVEDEASPNFPGAVVKSATGTDEEPTSLTVIDLTIKGQFSGSNSGGNLAGIHFDHADGSVTGSSIDRITHGNGVQEGQGIRVTNGDASSPETTLDLDGVTITNYQKTGIRINGNVDVTATGLDIGTAGTPGGTQLTTIAANGITWLNGPHGTIADSHIAANRYSGDDEGQTGPAAQATAMLVFNAGDIDATGLTIDGEDGDSGITLADGDDQGTLTVSCSTITREDGGNAGADPEMGFGIDNSAETDVVLNAVTLSGWPEDQDVVGPVTEGTSEACDTAVTATASAESVPVGEAVTFTGEATDADGGEIAGTVALQAKPKGAAEFETVDTGDTEADGSYELSDEPTKNTDYQVVFSAPASNDSTSDVVSVKATQTITAKIKPVVVRLGSRIGATGKISPANKAPVFLQRRVGTEWVDVATVRADETTGKYSMTWTTNVTGTYKLRVALKDRAGYGASNSVATKVTIKP